MTALLFDLDGTLADTAPDLHAAMNHVLREYGRAEVAAEEMRAMIGGGAAAILQRGFAVEGAELDAAELARATEIFIEYYDANINTHTRLFPNLLAVLDAARAAGVKCGVVTNKREGLSAKLLYRLGVAHYFEVLVGGDTLATRKPEPEMILEAMRRLGVDGAADGAVMIGDSSADIDAARAANIPSIAVTFGYPQGNPHKLGANAVINDYSELLDTLKNLGIDI